MEKATIFDYARMCKNNYGCESCPLFCQEYSLEEMTDEELQEANKLIIKWCKEHPVKTRQSELLKIFPNARIDSNGWAAICPLTVDKNWECNIKAENADLRDCMECLRNYWLAEVDE